eukprot:SAG11_NODE_1631_length_4544_cov_3.740832_4_plen_52_part_00
MQEGQRPKEEVVMLKAETAELAAQWTQKITEVQELSGVVVTEGGHVEYLAK